MDHAVDQVYRQILLIVLKCFKQAQVAIWITDKKFMDPHCIIRYQYMY